MTKEQFNEVATHPLQTWEWGEFRKAWGNEIIRLPFGQLTLHRLPLTPLKIGMFIKGPRPAVQMIGRLKKLGKEKNLVFIKLEPNFVPKTNQQINQLTNLLHKNDCVPGKTLFTPSTFWIDLTRPEDDILKSFHPKTRYNIRVAQKNGVIVKEDPTSLKLRGTGNSDKVFERYLQLTRETVERQGFYAHTEKYHRLMWEYLHPTGIAHLLAASYNGEIITTWILFVWKDFLYYPYGASTDKYKEVMANNLMMWEAIKLGKKIGLKTFDLWGREPGKGFTKFKEGYNPKVVEFLGTWDLVINKPAYYLYRLVEDLRWLYLRIKSKLGFSRQTF